jgi:hypothetical protein
VYGDRALKRTQIYDIIKKVKARKFAAEESGFNLKRQIRNPAFIVFNAAKAESDWLVSVKKIARAHDISHKTSMLCCTGISTCHRRWPDGSLNC